jgi:hypothetical protein
MRASRRLLLMGGGGVLQAFSLAGAFTDVIAVSTRDGSMVIRDSATPANNFIGKYANKATVNGSLTPDAAAGALFSNSDNLTFPTNVVSWSWAEVGAYVEIATSAVDVATADRILSMNSGAGNYMDIALSIGSTPDRAALLCNSGGIVANIIPAQGLSLSGNTIRSGWKLDNFAHSVDGVAGTPDSNGSIPTVNRVDIGYASHTASRGFKGRIPTVIIVPSRTAFIA